MTPRTLSPSQVNTFLSCSYAWYCEYVEKRPTSPSAPVALGSAVHDTVAVALRAKRQGYNMDLPELLGDHYGEAAEVHLSEARFSERESLAEEFERGRSMVSLWHAQALHTIRPVIVERKVTAKIGGVNVVGVLDIVDSDAVARDTKTSRNPPYPLRDVKPRHRLQMATYAVLCDVERVQLDHITANSKSSRYTPQQVTITDEDRRFVQLTYPAVAKAMDAGNVLPNRNAQFCSRRFCSHWEQCEKEWGGSVKVGL